VTREDGAEYHTLIRDLPANERPRERLRDSGAERLSNAELLAIILRTGMASENVIELSNRLLSQWGGLAGLHHASFAELCNTKGVGEAKAAQLKAALEIGRRLLFAEGDIRYQINDPSAVYRLFTAEMRLLKQEELRVILLSNKNHVIASPVVYRGTVQSSNVRPAEVFREAVRQTAPRIIIMHNHPSGDPTPSAEDVRTTRELVDAGRLLDIEVLDHVVIGDGRWKSLRQEGLGFGGK
jgi:DNA repair protein RadC